ncbi:aminoacyl-histidine dipeptidase [Hydrogenimonas sp.]|nr:aminoacyl-histidine dipeptidase [Hydrogenimonas sp.]
MIAEIEKIFKKITELPHCSGETSVLKEYIKKVAKECGYSVKSDAAGNVMAYGSGSRVTLQSHYDMVCIGRAPDIEVVVQEGWMSAKESSLGADNGIGVAIMIWLMQKRAKADFLFTNDEEIGLVGAAELELEIETPYLLNLDSEELGKVYIGCAGGEDIYVRKRIGRFTPETAGKRYILAAEAPGGHSGVNIAENIPNAVTELCSVIVENSAMQVASVKGGERINAIPAYAEAEVWMPEGHVPLVSNRNVRISGADTLGVPLLREGRNLAAALFGFAHGVRGWNSDLELPQSSINLAGVDITEDEVEIVLSARAMSNRDLERLVAQSCAGWQALGFECTTEGKYPAWSPEVNDFSKKVLEIYKKAEPEASYAAIHAGLECALFAERFEGLQIASVGPTILDPHSERERVELGSVETVVRVVEMLIKDLSTV